MPTAKATAQWNGTLREGSGRIKFASGVFEGPYSFKVRSEGGAGETTPEELIGAAHAGCFTMALSAQLTTNKTPPDQHPHGSRRSTSPPTRAASRSTASTSSPAPRSPASTTPNSPNSPKPPRKAAPSPRPWPRWTFTWMRRWRVNRAALPRAETVLISGAT